MIGSAPDDVERHVDSHKHKRDQLNAQVDTISAWYVAMNSDEAAEQRVFHLFWLPILRRKGDFVEPRDKGPLGVCMRP